MPRRAALLRRGLAATLAAAALAAARAPAAKGPPPPDLSKLLTNIHGTHLYEIELGRLAAGHGKDLRVRRFGQRLASDHRIADRRLIDLARAHGWRVDTTNIAPEERSALDQLSLLQGSDFDTALAASAQEGHRETMQRLEAAEAAVQDHAIRRYLDITMPIMHQHWLLAIRLRQPARRA